MSIKSQPIKAPPSPWREFLQELDASLKEQVELHCLGGFVLAVKYGSPRPTGDLDHIAAVPRDAIAKIQTMGGPDSKLAKKYKVYIHYAPVAVYPENYETRLHELFPLCFHRLRLLAFEAHDLALAKLTRNYPVDDADVQFLINKGILDPRLLRERYEAELRPYLSNPDTHDTTLRLWLEYFPQ